MYTSLRLFASFTCPRRNWIGFDLRFVCVCVCATHRASETHLQQVHALDIFNLFSSNVYLSLFFIDRLSSCIHFKAFCLQYLCYFLGAYRRKTNVMCQVWVLKLWVNNLWISDIKSIRLPEQTIISLDDRPEQTKKSKKYCI